MKTSPRRPLAACLLSAAMGLAATLPAHATPVTPAATLRDGAHDFDFNVGTWKTHIRRVTDPLSGNPQGMELNGTVTVHKIWDGRGQVEEIEADGPKGHWEGLTLFVYNPQARQWTQAFIDSADGVLTTPTIGEFHDGRGELYAQESFRGRTLLIRATWSDIKPDSHHFQEDFSTDGGRTWLPAFVAELTRIAP
jgi:Protein of unknown function (DUF1579)